MLAGALSTPVAAGHFDEMHGMPMPPSANANAGAAPATPTASQPERAAPPLAEHWSHFFESLGTEGFDDLNRRTAALHRQIRDNGVTYNVYADASGAQRPWSLDLFPLIVSPQSWQQIEAGVLQRVRVLEDVMADVYGPQRLLASGLLPPALVHGHPGYLRAMHGAQPAGNTHLHITAFDLARGPDGMWWVVSQRTQAPSGLGYLLENRLAISRQFPQAFESMQVQRLAGTYRALIDGLKRMSAAGAQAHIALLTPGPYNETYFEHAYLARYLGVTLVQGNDLTVRDQRLYLKTLKGLEPVHGLLKRLDDEFLDPLELRADSSLGIPGLLQAIRAGNVLVANAPGSAFLESPAMLGFMPALARHFLGEELQLPALASWWCGERAALEDVLPKLEECILKPTYCNSPGHCAFESALGRSLSRHQLDEWAGRIVRQSDEHTAQAYLPLSQVPTWQSVDGDERIVPRSVILRVFAVSDGPRSWRVLPGGMARIATAQGDIASMQRGGSSADVWVVTPPEQAVDTTTLLQSHHSPATLAHRNRIVTSRAAENLFWLGRYTERTENSLRLSRLALDCLNGDGRSSMPLLTWLGQMASNNILVQSEVPMPAQRRQVFERSLVASLASTTISGSVGYNLLCIKQAAFAVRERLSQEHWKVIVNAHEEFFRRCAAYQNEGQYQTPDALRVLDSASGYLAAITGAQTDRMTRDDGWRLLSIGRHIERLGFLAASLKLGFSTGSVHDASGFEAMIALFDSTITFRAHYQQSHDVAALLDLLVMDRDNPRSLGWVAHTLRGRLARLAGSAPGELAALSLNVPNPDLWDLEDLCCADMEHTPEETLTAEQGPTSTPLQQLLEQCTQSAYAVSDDISAVYFTHSGEAKQSLGI
jgi:uncharacterized circularly permuted ATP-grasp superfamily protein/uncharacterized alpha-E superfamily protein